jgi:uncharacterized protein YqgC (DUF456 family)
MTELGLTGEEYHLFWSVLALVVMAVGLIGVLVPVLPGLMLIWSVALIYGLIVGFGASGLSAMVVLSLIVVLSVVKSVILPRRAAAGAGASGWSQFGAVAGGVVGFFLVPVIGLILGALAGMVATEYSVKGNWEDAWTATKATAKGFGISALIDLVLGMVMITAWAVWAASVIW